MTSQKTSCMVVVLILTVISVLHATSVLEFPTCGRQVSTESSCISSSNSLITDSHYTRTDVECISKCRDKFPSDCSSAYRNQADGTCHMINDENGAGVETCTVNGDQAPGKFMDFIKKGASSSCGSHSCPSDQICIEGCHTESLSSPMCLADERDKCDQAMQFFNARHWWNDETNDGRDSGSTWFVTYPKLRHDTGLRFIQHGNIRGRHSVACHLYWVTFDGNKCTSPESIEWAEYSEYTGGQTLRQADVDGTCWGLAAGDIRVDVNVGACSGYSQGDSYTMWNSAASYIVMEIVPTSNFTLDAAKSCPSSIAFNYQYYSWNEESDVTFDASNGNNQLVKRVTYTKMAADSSLRIKYNAVLGSYVILNGHHYCGRWFIAINGVECDPMADIVIHQSAGYWDYLRDHRRIFSVEGVCDNSLDAGDVDIEIWIGQCYSARTNPMRLISGSLNVPSRIHVEEVRTDQKVDALYGPNWRMYKSLYANIEHWQWHRLNNGQDNGDILSFTYIKEFADTGLRLTASGLHRNIHCCGYGACARWYFKIDGSHCGTPGRIEAASYEDYHTDDHIPLQTSGICYGISAGSRTIAYAVNGCDGYNPSEAYTGWESTFHVFVEEWRVDLYKNCGATQPVNCDD